MATKINYLGSNGLATLVDQLKAWAKSAAENAVAGFDHSIFRVVTELPDPAEAESDKIYLVPDTESVESENVYDEYVIVSGAWEKLGSFKADVDLSGYKVKDIAVSGDYITVTFDDGTYTIKVAIPEATTEAAGLLSAEDKAKLDSINADTIVNEDDLEPYAKTEDLPTFEEISDDEITALFE
ncbi:MAG: hypothetical protein LUC33_00935 [Prevotellaceae bacterium]|nr:hypothetical protein [Prevotellaceae bacterium]